VKSRGTLVIVVLVVALLGVAFALRITAAKKKTEAAKAQVEKVVVAAVRTVTAQKKDLPQVVQITGSVKAHNEVQVLPRMPGRITRVAVDVGSLVKADAVLATTDSADMALRVKQAEAQMQATRAGLEQARLQQATAARGLERAKALREKGAMTQLDFENSETSVALAAVGVQAAEAQLALASAHLEMAQKALDDTRITTPISGVVTKKLVNQGTMANPATPSFFVQDQSSLKLEGSVPAAYVPLVKAGMKVVVEVDELPGRSFEGSVTRIAPSLDAETRRGGVEIALSTRDGVLPWMFARAEIAFGTTADVVVVPSAAVVSVGGDPAVFVVRDGKAVMLRPKLGARHDDDIVVEEGVSVGDNIVVSGATGLKDGAPVTATDG
jgi:RND family efflux transporter MFP subunit